MTENRTDTPPDRTPATDPSSRRRVKVVGYDRSDNGRNVIAGAVRRVRPGDRLIIVHAMQPALDRSDDPAARYDEVCHQMIAELDPSVLDGIDHELRVVDGRPAQALIEVALHTQAVAIVIGTRRSPSRLGQRTIRSQLEAGPVPVVALVGEAERAAHPAAEPIDSIFQQGYDSFPASDPPSSWSGAPTARRKSTTGAERS